MVSGPGCVRRARFAVANKDFITELKLLQEVLADAQWRAVPLAETDSGALAQASTVAERMIGELQRLSPDRRGLTSLDGRLDFAYGLLDLIFG